MANAQPNRQVEAPAPAPPTGDQGSGGGGGGASTLPEFARTVGVYLITGALLVMFVVWLIVTGLHIDARPVYQKDVLLYDPFLRAKDVLTVLLPLLTTVVAFWVGTQGSARAQRSAEDAQKEATAARESAAKQQAQIDMLRAQFPDAFR